MLSYLVSGHTLRTVKTRFTGICTSMENNVSCEEMTAKKLVQKENGEMSKDQNGVF